VGWGGVGGVMWGGGWRGGGWGSKVFLGGVWRVGAMGKGGFLEGVERGDFMGIGDVVCLSAGECVVGPDAEVSGGPVVIGDSLIERLEHISVVKVIEDIRRLYVDPLIFISLILAQIFCGSLEICVKIARIVRIFAYQ
jgi:hypothetical protein